MNNAPKIHALHRYFIWANRMKHHCFEAIQEQGEPPPGGIEFRLWFSAPFSYACYWLATLHVVVEGMQKLKITDPVLTTLLSDIDKLKKLRRFRNGVYHYQETYFDNRFKDFLNESYLDWANDLHNGLSQYFLDWYASRGTVIDIAENTNERIRLVLKNSSENIEIILEEVDGESDD